MLLSLAVLAALQQPIFWPPEVTWTPAVPRQGSLIIVYAPNAVQGTLAGEPLHFSEGRAVGAIPLSATDSISVHVLIRRNGAVSKASTVGAVAERREGGERIRAADRFTAPPAGALLARINRERELSRAAARRAHDVQRFWDEPFIRPRDARITSPFGAGRLVNGVWRSRHYGLDLDGRTGEPVRAANRGIVALVGSFFYGGRSVYLLHGDGLMTIYNHLSRRLVAKGDTVERGQVIGHVGATGRVTGPHLHWQAQYGGIAFDPADLLTLQPPPPQHPRASPASPD